MKYLAPAIFFSCFSFGVLGYYWGYKDAYDKGRQQEIQQCVDYFYEHKPFTPEIRPLPKPKKPIPVESI